METIAGGRYRVVKTLGRGARGVVHLAEDTKLKKTVALKLFENSAAVPRNEIENEFPLLSRLDHPSLAKVYDIGFDAPSKRSYIAQEYFDGEPLSRKKGLPWEDVSRIAAQLCQCLQYLHQKGVFHGDLQPENVLVRGGEIRLIDFGIARTFEGYDPQGTVSGTLPYVAPEIFLGTPIDGRADLYSLGAVLYEAVSGRLPFAASRIAVLAEKHLFETPSMPVPEGADVPREFGFLILRLLEKDPPDRFEEANDVIRSLNLQFRMKHALGPEKAALSPEKERALRAKRVDRVDDQAILFYRKKEDPESRRILAEIHYRRGDWDEAEKLLKEVVGRKADLLRLQIGLKKGDFERVRREGEKMAKTAAEASDAGALLNALGTAHYYLGNYPASEEAFRRAAELFEKAADSGGRATLWNNIANLKVKDGKLDEAIALYQKSVALCREGGDVTREGLFLTSLGYAYHVKGDYDAALAHYRQSEAVLGAIGYRAGAAKTKLNLANLLITKGSLEKGEEKLNECESLAREKGDRFTQAYAAILRGDLWARRAQKAKALGAYREAEKEFLKLNNPHEVGVVRANIERLKRPESADDPGEENMQNATLPFLKRILSINRKLSLLQDVETLLELLLDSMIEFTGGERGWLILKEGDRKVVRVARNLDKDDAASADSFSSSLVDKVMKTGDAVVTMDAMTDGRFSESLSVHRLKLRSVVCVPLNLRDEVIGAIYVDHRLQKGAFTPETIELLQAFADQAAIAITNASAFTDLKQSLAQKQSALELKYRYDEIVGRSPKMVEALKLLDRVTESVMPVSIQGESGTGKELIARAIHYNSGRAKSPFVAVNCTAVPETLMESEFFGYVRGAFTGADRDKEGLFEAADGGTLFLDEIGDMPLIMQAKLLRVLQDKEVRRVGSKSGVKVDVRIVSASHRDLKALVKEKKFREDLFYRLQGVKIPLPPLRDRKEDMPLLIDHLLAKFAKDHGSKRKTLTRKAFELLAAYDWPGNIRELENTVNNACLVAEGPKILPEDLRQKEELASAEGYFPISSGDQSLRESLMAFEKSLIQKMLNDHHGNISRAAEHLKTPRPHLSRLIKKYRLKTKSRLNSLR